MSPPSTEPPLDEAALAKAKGAMKTLGATLKGELMAGMGAGGPTAALDVCSQQAGSLTAGVTATTGVRVGRSSLRLRNPENQAPDWVGPWLEEQGERSAEGVTPHTSGATLADGAIGDLRGAIWAEAEITR